jgi:Hemerythrin HHE cation binding domain
MPGSAEDVVAAVQRDHRSTLRDLYAIAKLGSTEQATRFWPVADRLVRRELAMELVVYPAIGELPEAEMLARGLLHEEGQILERVFEIEHERPEAGRPFELELSRLRVAVADHIGHEEAEVVPLLIGSFPAEQRSAMRPHYDAVRDFEPGISEPDLPATRTIVGRLAILAEWIRDSVSGNGLAIASTRPASDPAPRRPPDPRTAAREDYSG